MASSPRRRGGFAFLLLAWFAAAGLLVPGQAAGLALSTSAAAADPSLTTPLPAADCHGPASDAGRGRAVPAMPEAPQHGPACCVVSACCLPAAAPARAPAPMPPGPTAAGFTPPPTADPQGLAIAPAAPPPRDLA